MTQKKTAETIVTSIISIRITPDGKLYKIHPKNPDVEDYLRKQNKTKMTIKLIKLMGTSGSVYGSKDEFYPMRDKI